MHIHKREKKNHFTLAWLSSWVRHLSWQQYALQPCCQMSGYFHDQDTEWETEKPYCSVRDWNVDASVTSDSICGGSRVLFWGQVCTLQDEEVSFWVCSSSWWVLTPLSWPQRGQHPPRKATSQALMQISSRSCEVGGIVPFIMPPVLPHTPFLSLGKVTFTQNIHIQCKPDIVHPF